MALSACLTGAGSPRPDSHPEPGLSCDWREKPGSILVIRLIIRSPCPSVWPGLSPGARSPVLLLISDNTRMHHRHPLSPLSRHDNNLAQQLTDKKSLMRTLFSLLRPSFYKVDSKYQIDLGGDYVPIMRR